MNIKSAFSQNETDSAIAKGNENDGSKNYQINFNAVKWLNNNLKFKSTLYSRKTLADYDNSATDEHGYVSDNRMHALQTGIEHISTSSETDIKFHYHNYDREYQNGGYLDEYYSESLVLKGEKRSQLNNNFSLGFGSEYKYDWGYFENRGSYNASTKGDTKDLGIFGNFGFKLNENQIFSFYSRLDDHNTTGLNQTFKINFLQNIDKFSFGITHSNALRNPTLYELYGTDNYGIKGKKNLKPEKSETNELTIIYDINENYKLETTGYRAKVFDQIETNAGYTTYENQSIDINQEGLESSLSYSNNFQKFSLFGIFSKSRKSNGQAQNRRPDLSYGLNLFQKIKKSPIGLFDINLNYKFTGKYIDYDGSKNSRQKETDILDLYLIKNIIGNSFSIKITNLLDEKYEKPATYSQNGRKITFAYKKLF